jgi:hypothetical protein
MAHQIRSRPVESRPGWSRHVESIMLSPPFAGNLVLGRHVVSNPGQSCAVAWCPGLSDLVASLFLAGVGQVVEAFNECLQ